MKKQIAILDQFIQDFYADGILDRTYYVCHLFGGMLEDNAEFDTLPADTKEKIEKISELINGLYQELGAKQAEEQVNPKMIHGPAYVTIYKPVAGWKSILLVWNDEMGEYEPENTGYFAYPDDMKDKAIADAKSWAEAEEVPYVENNGKD